jgi:hypothetical protein
MTKPAALAISVVALLVASLVAVGRATSQDQASTGAAPRPVPPSGTAPVATTTTAPAAVPAPRRDRSVYEGLGAWVDVYDYVPVYQKPAEPQLVVAQAVDELAARGVRTLFLQATRLDPRSPEGIVDRGRVGEFLERARSRGIRVVGWYLPKFADVDADLANLLLIRDFEFEGHRFDGIAVDIEWRQDVPRSTERNRRLIELSERLRQAVGADALGAIVLPPVLTELVNPAYWPDFAWSELAPYYDVWLPMTYWTFRPSASGYRDGHRYTDESIRRLRANLGNPAAAVHPIGGIADAATEDDYRDFVRAARENGAVGLSMYDLRTTHEAGWSALQRR